jgi:hypothetical protein
MKKLLLSSFTIMARPTELVREVIQSWPEHCERELGKNDCLKGSAGSEQWDTALSCEIVGKNG